MFNKLVVLIKMQLSEKIRIDRSGNKNALLGAIGKMIVHMGISYGVFVAVFLVVFKLLSFTASIHLFTFVIFVMQAISVLICTVGMSDALYLSKDNMLLLTYPVKHVYVYVSKLCVSYILQLIKSLIFTFPLFMAYGTIVSGVFSVNYLFSSMIFSAVLPLFPVLLGAILSIPLVYATKLIRKYSVSKIVLTALVFAGLVVLTAVIVKALPDNLRIVALYKGFITKCNETFSKADRFSLYVLFVGRILYSQNIALNYLIVLGILAGLFVVSVALSLPLFFSLASAQAEHSVQKPHKSSNRASSSPFTTFLRKEITLSVRNMGDFISDYLFLFLMPFLLIVMASIYVRIDRNPLGEAMTYGFLGFIAMLMLSASNTASSTALSSEGTEFVLLKTSPVDTKAILYAKLLVNFVVAFLCLTLSFLALTVVLNGKVEIARLWAVYGGVLLLDLGLMFWSIQFDVLDPRFRDYANSRNRSKIANYSKSLLVGCVTALLYSVIMILLFVLGIGIAVKVLAILGVALLFTAVRVYFFVNYVNAYFDDIQI